MELLLHELRSYAHKRMWDGRETYDQHLLYIADQIEEELTNYIELPKDADGEPIHLQDRMSWDNGTFDVHELKLDADGWTTWDELHGYTVRADQCRHYHEPTVEDVLREFTDEVWNRCCGGATASDSGIDELVADYAAKLRLAGDAG